MLPNLQILSRKKALAPDSGVLRITKSLDNNDDNDETVFTCFVFLNLKHNTLSCVSLAFLSARYLLIFHNEDMADWSKTKVYGELPFLPRLENFPVV